MSSIKDWLQLFRAQSAPLSVILTTIAFLYDQHIDTHLFFMTIILVILMTIIHFLSYGQNSLNDTIMGYDSSDQYKSHHPLVNGKLSMSSVMFIIHVGLIIVTTMSALLTIYEGQNVVAGLFCLLLWYVFGNAYNGGLSKESLLNAPLFGGLFTSAVLWAYFLTHEELTIFIIIYVCFIFTLTYYQIASEGNLIGIINEEHSNILLRLGSKVTKSENIDKETGLFVHDSYNIEISKNAYDFMRFAKFINLGCTALLLVYFFDGLVLQNDLQAIIYIIIFLWWIAFTMLSIGLYDQLTNHEYIDFTQQRPYLLKIMSFDQIATIYAIIPLLVNFTVAIVLAVYGVLWFIILNKLLWKTLYPDV